MLPGTDIGSETMTAKDTSLDRIQELKAEIARLEGEALNDLKAKRDSILAEVREIDAQIALLTGIAGEVATTRKRSPREAAKIVPSAELKALLEKAPDKTLSIRKENFDLRSIKELAARNPSLFRMGGNGPWPTVTLLP